MEQMLEKLQAESESLYHAVLKAAKKKWNVSDFQKLSQDLYIVTMGNVKKPDKSIKYKCFYVQNAWTIWSYEDDNKLKDSIAGLKK